MQLTLYTDYSLRVLIYLALHGDEVSTITEISEAYGISRNHLVKVVHNLSQQGFIQTSRGKFGGLWLDRSPERINIGEVVRHTEPNFDLVECFNVEENTCPLGGVCTLQKVLTRASRQFMKELDQHTLADLVPNRKRLRVALGQA